MPILGLVWRRQFQVLQSHTQAAVAVACNRLVLLLAQVVRVLAVQVAQRRQQTAIPHQMQTLAAVVVVLQAVRLQRQRAEMVRQVLSSFVIQTLTI
jgi:hypothetical protein